MPKGRIAVNARTSEYWKSKLDEYYSGCIALPERMPTAQRRYFTREKGEILKEKAAVGLLINQARLVLKEEGFTDDEIECCLKNEPELRGTAPVMGIDKLVAHYFYERMTGQALQEERALTPEAQQSLENDKQHRLNTMEAKLLVRELLGISQSTLGKLLNK